MVLELSRKLFYSTMNGSDSVLSQLLVGFILIFFSIWCLHLQGIPFPFMLTSRRQTLGQT